jgi:hypothetical protein
MSNTRTHIEQADGTLWLCSKLDDPYGRHIAGREYWVSYCNGPATITGGIVGFYANSVSAARAKLEIEA